MRTTLGKYKEKAPSIATSQIPQRHEDMQGCAQQLLVELEKFKALGKYQGLEDSFFQMVENRIKGKPLRAYFIIKLFDYVKALSKSQWKRRLSNTSSDRLFHQKIPFIFEVIISIQYLHNQILDGKASVNTPEKINTNLLKANLLKDLLYEYIEDSFNWKIGGIIRKTVRTAFQLVDYGQYVEKNWNNYQVFQQPGLIEKFQLGAKANSFIQLEGAMPFMEQLRKEVPDYCWPFTELYLKRIYLTCGALFQLGADLILELTDYKGEQKDNIRKFSICYGLMRQLINDNADFVPSSFNLDTKSKTSSDAFSDLRNQNITLPLLLYLLEKSTINPFQQYLDKPNNVSLAKLEPQLFEELLQSNALFKSIQLGRLLSRLSQAYLIDNTEAAMQLKDTCNIAFWNKFLYPCLRNPWYKKYKKTYHYQQIQSAIKQVQSFVENTPVKAPVSLLHQLPFSLKLKAGLHASKVNLSAKI